MRFDVSLARGLGYYTGCIFEIAVEDLAGSLGGGGRYDNLIGMFLGKQVPACGFTLGLERILVVMAERGMFPSALSQLDVVVAAVSDDKLAAALRLSGELRNAGMRVDLRPNAIKPGKLRKHADELGVRAAVWIEPEQTGTASVWTSRRPADAQRRGDGAHRRADRTRDRDAGGRRSMNQQAGSLLEELRWRGLLHQTTATDAQVEAHLSQKGRVGYAGFDPTKDSLTIGNLVAIKLLMHLQRAGHRPIALVGGGTGLIGDPSGKDSERQLLDHGAVEANVAGQRRVFERMLDFSVGTSNAAMLVNNADWLCKVGFVDVLRDVGKHFSVNAMIQKDSVRERLHNREQGISYTEFSYMLLQAYDFLHLKRTHDCSLQLAGSDQFGNIVAGVDLIHRVLGREGDQGEAYGVTAPLLLGADGKKVGKTEKGAVWLTADRTSPYAFYQYWINVDDADVISFLKLFTFLGREEIDAIATEHTNSPEQRAAQRALAREMTSLVHGAAEYAKVESASRALFGGDVRALDAQMLADVFADVPHTDHNISALGGDGIALADLLAETSLASSKREARQFLQSGAVAVNGERVDAAYRVTGRDLLHGGRVLLRRGKRLWHATRWA